MSVADRLADAEVLRKQGRQEGALLLVLVAVAATSRKRYPKGQKSDREAFTIFIDDEMPTIVGVKDLPFRYHGELVPLSSLLYEYVRCKFVHEATLPEDIKFRSGETPWVNVTPESITFYDGLINGLEKAVKEAEENSEIFPGDALLKDLRRQIRDDHVPG